MLSLLRFTSSSFSITIPQSFISVLSKASLLGRQIITQGKVNREVGYDYLQTFLDRILNLRQEECAPGGCFVELSVELAIIFMGKQFVLSIMEYCMPLIWRALNLLMGWSLKVVLIK